MEAFLPSGKSRIILISEWVKNDVLCHVAYRSDDRWDLAPGPDGVSAWAAREAESHRLAQASLEVGALVAKLSFPLDESPNFLVTLQIGAPLNPGALPFKVQRLLGESSPQVQWLLGEDLETVLCMLALRTALLVRFREGTRSRAEFSARKIVPAASYSWTATPSNQGPIGIDVIEPRGTRLIEANLGDIEIRVLRWQELKTQVMRAGLGQLDKSEIISNLMTKGHGLERDM